MRDYLKYFIFIFFILICVIVTVVFTSNVKDEEDVYFISELLIYVDGVEYEIKVNQNDKVTLFRENDIEEVMYQYPREGRSRISFPNLEDIEGENTIEGLDTVVNYTYNLSYIDSYKYLKYLVDEGYSIEMYVSTPQYLEVFLLKDNMYKRVVLFADSLMVCDMLEGVELPPVWEYLRSYNFNDFVEKKFGVDFENNSK